MPKKPETDSTEPSPEARVLAGLLRELRGVRKMRQDEVAIALGVSQTTVSEIELGKRGVDLLVCRRLVRIYEASWTGFITELDRRLQVLPTPAGDLLNAEGASV